MRHKTISFLVLLLFVSIHSYAHPLKKWDVSSFGAKGDGETIDTKSIQRAIDSCHEAGGGTVYLSNGTFLSGTIILKSHVGLHIEHGAVLMGSTMPEDYKVIEFNDPITSEKYNLGKALIYSEGESNISITGNGVIDGNGDILSVENKVRAHLIHINNCNNIKVKDLTLRNGSWWIQKYNLCDKLYIDGITVDSRENKDLSLPRYADTPGRNTDGCNIVDSKNVRISNCDIYSGDDGIVMKSFLRENGCHNITISNCMISTNASGIKVGTETAGTFHDIVINNCVVYDTRLGGIELMVVDGGKIENVIVSDITLNNIHGAAIFVRLGNRGRVYRNNQPPPPVGQVKKILIQNIYGTEIDRYGCSITGIPDASVEDVILKNINLSFTGGDGPLYFEGYPHKAVKHLSIDNVPEEEKSYPRCDLFGKLPAYGFYIRHSKGIQLDNIKLSFNKNDHRPAIVVDDAYEFYINNCRAQGTTDTPSLIHLRNVKQGIIQNSGSTNAIPVFVQVSGAQTRDLKIRSEISADASIKYLIDNSVDKSEINCD